MMCVIPPPSSISESCSRLWDGISSFLACLSAHLEPLWGGVGVPNPVTKRTDILPCLSNHWPQPVRGSPQASSHCEAT